MKTNDYVKYMTEALVKYMDQPKDERLKRKQVVKENRASFMYRWFGILPYLFASQVKRRRRKQD